LKYVQNQETFQTKVVENLDVLLSLSEKFTDEINNFIRRGYLLEFACISCACVARLSDLLMKIRLWMKK
jgi:hypothetical protein